MLDVFGLLLLLDLLLLKLLSARAGVLLGVSHFFLGLPLKIFCHPLHLFHEEVPVVLLLGIPREDLQHLIVGGVGVPDSNSGLQVCKLALQFFSFSEEIGEAYLFHKALLVSSECTKWDHSDHVTNVIVFSF